MKGKKIMNMETFLMLLMVVSVFTGLFTEAIKMCLDYIKVNFASNILAGAVAVVLSALVSTAYMLLAEIAYTDKMMVYLIALVLLSWLSAMVGYDKVVQALTQFKNTKEE